MKLAPKLVAPIAAMCAVLIAVASGAIWLQHYVSEADDLAIQREKTTQDAGEARSMSRAAQRDVLKIMDPQWASAKTSLANSIKTRIEGMNRHALASVQHLPEGDGLRASVVNAQKTVGLALAKVVELALAGNLDAAKTAFRSEVEPVEKKASEVVDRFVADALAAAKASEEESQRRTTLASRILIIGALLASLASFAGVLVFVLRSVVRPAIGLTKDIAQIAEGRFETQVSSTDRVDELGEMARAVDRFRTDLAQGEVARRHAAAKEAQIEQERQRAQQERDRAAQEVADVVDALSESLADLADGNLTARIRSDFAPQYQRVKINFNESMERLELAVCAIIESSNAIQSGTADISEASSSLSARTEQQAANLEESAAALEEVTATVKRTASEAIKANEATAQTRSTVSRAGKVVAEAMQAMNGIEHASHEISKIIGVIDEIAFQTNLLALNAGVEAARAGETGRGFAVVASEVRALAQRSAEAAKEIKVLINNSMSQVECGVSLVSETGQALSEITGQVSSVAEIVSHIAVSSQEQATAIEEVNAAVSSMDQITQQNAAMVEETTAASHSLAGEAAQMRQQVARFRVDGTPGTAGARRAA